MTPHGLFKPWGFLLAERKVPMMAIKVTFLTVVTRIETVERRYPGGVDAYVKENLVADTYRDRNIVGVLFMSSGEAEEFIAKLLNLSFSYDEIALIDQFVGLLSSCNWLGTSIISYFSRKPGVKESTCWLKRSIRETLKNNGVRYGKI